jgi:DNA-binding NarL/FixJ family response regulator
VVARRRCNNGAARDQIADRDYLHNDDAEARDLLLAPGVAGVLLPNVGLRKVDEHEVERKAVKRPACRSRKDVLNSLRSGQQNKNVVYELGIAESAVRAHLRNIMQKLRATNRTQRTRDLERLIPKMKLN